MIVITKKIASDMETTKVGRGGFNLPQEGE